MSSGSGDSGNVSFSSGLFDPVIVSDNFISEAIVINGGCAQQVQSLHIGAH